MNRNRDKIIWQLMLLPGAMAGMYFALERFGVPMQGWVSGSTGLAMLFALAIAWIARAPAAPSTDAVVAKARLEAMRDAEVWAREFVRREFAKRAEAERRATIALADRGKYGFRRYGSSQLVPEPVNARRAEDAGEHPAARGEGA